MFMKKITPWCLAAGCLMLASQGWSSEKDRETFCEDEEKAEQSKSQLCSEEDEYSCKEEEEEEEGEEEGEEEDKDDIIIPHVPHRIVCKPKVSPEEERRQMEAKRQRTIEDSVKISLFPSNRASRYSNNHGKRTRFIGIDNQGDGNTFVTSVLNMLSTTKTYGNFADSIIGYDREKARMEVRKLRKGLGLQERGAGSHYEFLEMLLEEKLDPDPERTKYQIFSCNQAPERVFLDLANQHKRDFFENNFSCFKEVFFIEGNWNLNEISGYKNIHEYAVLSLSISSKMTDVYEDITYHLTSAILFNPQAATYNGKPVGQYVSLVKSRDGNWFIVDSNDRVSPAEWEQDKLSVDFGPNEFRTPAGDWKDYRVVMACYEKIYA